jgi:HlyD family secretion protein
VKGRVKRPYLTIVAVALVGIAAGFVWSRSVGPPAVAQPAGSQAAARLAPVLRLAGTVEATRSRAVLVPRLSGQTTPTLVITSLVRAGTLVREGDLIVEFDRQEQLRIARDRTAELVELDGQLLKKRSEQSIAESRDQTALSEAESNVSRAALDVRKNELVSRVEAEKNTLALDQAKARLAQLRKTFALKRRAAEADLKILEIQRGRAERALRYAEGNAGLMAVKAPFSGMVVLKQIWKGNSQAEVAEGEEVRPGLPILDIVDASAMQVRALVNQADISRIEPGQPAKIRLDAYPDLLFDGRIELLAPFGVASSLTPKVRSFTAVISIHGSHPQLMPDLSASVEVTPAPPAPHTATTSATH